MDIRNKRVRLKELLEQNIRNEKIGTAIAITGSWGVGKTYFWNKFLESELSEERIYKKDNVFNRKYAYVSLFGLESLSDLKTQIYSNIENYHSSIEVPKWLKGLPSIFKDTRINQLGISAPAKLIDSLMFNQVKEAIICFDDFERMSNKLDIKDVMGLANQLKLERNCQVVLILDESKTEEKNKEKYTEYKEKLIDETIKITSVEPLIRARAKEENIDEPLINLMVKFANELEIHNFRFFQKVIKLYKQFLEQLPSEVAESTKEIILIRILQGYFIEDFGLTCGLSWNDFTFKMAVRRQIAKNNEANQSEKENLKLSKLRNISSSFERDDLWMIEFKKWFEQSNKIDFESLKELAQSDLINTEQEMVKNGFWILCNEFWNYQCDETFIQRFFESSIKNIGLLSLGNLDFAITILEQLGGEEESKKLEKKVKNWICEKLELDRKFFRSINSFRHGEHRFGDYIDEVLLINPNIGAPSFIDSIYAYFINQQYSEQHEFVIVNASKEELRYFIEFDFFEDERFVNITIAHLVEKFSQDKKQLIIEILKEKGNRSDFQKKYTDYLISRLDN
ncbi:hypothetical protein [Acinetobacter sp. BSP-28]|uniref:hypothetical protein n=1 Tax=Acinetobacter sp. BSP-28 TaxID=3344661 RepID=UPI00376F70AB